MGAGHTGCSKYSRDPTKQGAPSQGRSKVRFRSIVGPEPSCEGTPLQRDKLLVFVPVPVRVPWQLEGSSGGWTSWERRGGLGNFFSATARVPDGSRAGWRRRSWQGGNPDWHCAANEPAAGCGAEELVVSSSTGRPATGTELASSLGGSGGSSAPTCGAGGNPSAGPIHTPHEGEEEEAIVPFALVKSEGAG